MCAFNKYRGVFYWRAYHQIKPVVYFPGGAKYQSHHHISLTIFHSGTSWHHFCRERWYIYSGAWHLAPCIVICPSMIFDEAVCQRLEWQPPPTARKQVNPVLQGCIMSSQGTIGCFARHGASFLSRLCSLLFICPGPTPDLDASHSL